MSISQHYIFLAFRFFVFTCLIASAIYLALNSPIYAAIAFAFLAGFVIALIIACVS